MNSITKYPKRFDLDGQILIYWLMYCRAPGKKTLPGEPVDLGEIGEVRELKVNRMTPYSVSERDE